MLNNTLAKLRTLLPPFSGTGFTVLAQPSNLPISSTPQEPEPVATFRKTRVLIAGSDDLLLTLERHLFGTVQWAEVVGISRDGWDVVQKVVALSPDVLILDAQLDLVNGLEALAEIRRRKLPVKVVLSSSEDYESKWREAGADAFFKKWKPLNHLLDLAREAVR
jgi:NarL family two-component system response regulator LiaR